MSMDPAIVTADDLQRVREQVLKAMKAHPTPWGVTFKTKGRVYDSDGEGVAIVGDPAVAYLLVYAPGNLAALVAEVERLRAADTTLRAAVETLAEELRDDLWVGGDDYRGHAYYERLVDLVHAANGEE